MYTDQDQLIIAKYLSLQLPLTNYISVDELRKIMDLEHPNDPRYQYITPLTDLEITMMRFNYRDRIEAFQYNYKGISRQSDQLPGTIDNTLIVAPQNHTYMPARDPSLNPNITAIAPLPNSKKVGPVLGIIAVLGFITLGTTLGLRSYTASKPSSNDVAETPKVVVTPSLIPIPSPTPKASMTPKVTKPKVVVEKPKIQYTPEEEQAPEPKPIRKPRTEPLPIQDYERDAGLNNPNYVPRRIFRDNPVVATPTPNLPLPDRIPTPGYPRPFVTTTPPPIVVAPEQPIAPNPQPPTLRRDVVVPTTQDTVTLPGPRPGDVIILPKRASNGF